MWIFFLSLECKLNNVIGCWMKSRSSENSENSYRHGCHSSVGIGSLEAFVSGLLVHWARAGVCACDGQSSGFWVQVLRKVPEELFS